MRVILFRNISERERLTKEYMKKMEEGSRGHTMEGLQRNMKTFGLLKTTEFNQNRPLILTKRNITDFNQNMAECSRNTIISLSLAI